MQPCSRSYHITSGKHVKMKSFLVVAVILASAAAAPIDEASAPVVKSDFEITPEGTFQFAYETGNGIIAQATGTLKNNAGEYPTLVVSGGYQYTGNDGIPVQLSYTADENGYQAVGSHIPTSPPIPAAIQRSIEYIAANPPAASYDKPAKASALLG